jgi:hypothetical protein
MWTLSERTFIQSLLNRQIPIAVIVHILLKNRERGMNKWGEVKFTVNLIRLIAWWRYTRFLKINFMVMFRHLNWSALVKMLQRVFDPPHVGLIFRRFHALY